MSIFVPTIEHVDNSLVMLDKDVIRLLLDIPLWEISDLHRPSEFGDKKILGEVYNTNILIVLVIKVNIQCIQMLYFFFLERCKNG